MDWPAEAQKAQDALRAAALTAAGSAEAADEEAPDGGSDSHGEDHAQASTGMQLFWPCFTCISTIESSRLDLVSTGEAHTGQMYAVPESHQHDT